MIFTTDMLKEACELSRGRYMILRADDSFELVRERPTMEKIYEAIGENACDGVVLTTDGAGMGVLGIIVGDHSSLQPDRLMNVNATNLVRMLRPERPPILLYGNAVLYDDRDFD